jgi:hypothetical protein
MKLQTLVCIASLRLGAAVPTVGKRQLGILNRFLPVQKPYSIKETAGELRTNSRHVSVTYGPYNVPGGKVSIDIFERTIVSRIYLLTSEYSGRSC